jgi:putative ABC transport system permease protein
VSSYVFTKFQDTCQPGGGCSSSGVEAKIVDPADAAVLSPRPDEVRAALEAGKAVAFDRRAVQPGGTVSVTVQTSADDGSTPPTERSLSLPVVLLGGPDRLDGVLLPRNAITGLGLRLEPVSLVARTTGPVDRVALEEARTRLSAISPDLFVGVERGPQEEDPPMLTIAVLALAVLVALVGTFTAVGLAAADARPDLGTLAAVGADPAVRRRIGAAQAATIAVPGAVLGCVAGIVGAAVLVRLNSRWSYYSFVDWHVRVPVAPTLALVVGLPALAVALGWLTVRSRLDVVRRLGE